MDEKKLTVLQVLPALQSGGVERGTLEVGKYLVDHGHRSLVISAGGRMVEQLQREGSEHFAWDIGKKSPWTLRLIGPLRRFLAEQRVDILHVRSRMPAWICYLAWKGMDPASRPHFVTTVHGPYSVGRYSAVMTKGERVIVISEMIRKYVLENYNHVDPGKLRLIYRGVDSEEFPYGYKPSEAWLNQWHKDFPQTRGKRLITLPARITRWKGQEHFIDLVNALRKDHPDIHGLMVGGLDPRRRQFEETLRNKVRTLGLEQAITFTGHRSDLREIMSISSLVLSLSVEPEAFGRTTLEALRLGIPTAGYGHGGVGETLRAIYPAGLLELDNPSKTLETIEHILKTSPMVPQGDFFPLSEMLGKTFSVYAELED
jgi:glycosyltransferase involved in cell wall biosynthesis